MSVGSQNRTRNAMNANPVSGSSAQSRDGLPLGPGALVLVVGPSGAGKDTLLRLARDSFATDALIAFPKRIVTRGPDAHEDHLPMPEEAFAAYVARGDAALWWRAHGLGYAVPGAVDAVIAAGGIVVVNVSRRIIASAAGKYSRLAVVHVTAPAKVLAERLARRGREDAADVAGRLGRASEDLPDAPNLVVIENVGDPAIGARRLVRLIGELRTGTDPAGAAAAVSRAALPD